jgi:hypothetical protein
LLFAIASGFSVSVVAVGTEVTPTVDSSHQVIVAADVSGSGSEQSMLVPMVQQSNIVRAEHTLITADAGYHSNDNVAALKDANIPAMIADNQMRQRDERFKDQGKHKAKADPLYDKRATGQETPIRLYRPSDFTHDPSTNTCICPAALIAVNSQRPKPKSGNLQKISCFIKAPCYTNNKLVLYWLVH